jgi:hypothetical protein
MQQCARQPESFIIYFHAANEPHAAKSISRQPPLEMPLAEIDWIEIDFAQLLVGMPLVQR